ncbi:P-II family nitrogen regulator [soil metagenome]
MKKIEAIIKPFLLEDVKDGLHELGIVGITVSEIKNFRPSRAAPAPRPDPASPGARDAAYGTANGSGYGIEEANGIGFAPRLKLEVVVAEARFAAAWECIGSCGRIANDFGDELIVQNLSDVVRIRTDEHGEAAI